MRVILSILLVSQLFVASGQSISIVPSDSMKHMHAWKTTKKGMFVLSSWAALNIGSGFYLASKTTGSTSSFHQMNGLWNTVNLGLGVIGYFTARKKMNVFNADRFPSDIKKQIKILRINSYLDLGYMAAGGALWALSDRTKSPKISQGYGISIITQGAFLFLFDRILAKKIENKAIHFNVY